MTATLKQRVMTLLVAARLDWLVIAYWRLKGDPTAQFSGRGLKDVFNNIYKHNIWMGSPDTTTSSGKGSSIEGTSHIRTQLPVALKEIGATGLIDIGCGDYHWMSQTPLEIDYVGIDVAESVISRNKIAFPDVKFACMDATTEKLPPYSAALCREVIFHLSFKDGLRLIQNIKSSGISYLICTTDPRHTYNADIPSGAWRDLNLEISPYNFPQPLIRIPDGQPDNPSRQLCVWNVNELPQKFSK